MDIDLSPAQQRSSRKHLRSSDEYEASDWSSDVSGRFDDAPEEPELEDYKTSSAKTVKRRRSNDWPLPEEAADYGHHGHRAARNGARNANLTPSHTSSPRASATSLRARYGGISSHSPRTRLGRRSRFVEATMSDSVSEKPPSIFMRESKPAGPHHRGSGIFRFGKAIASAFNPFGGWSKSTPENVTKPQAQKDALSQAEQAYAELKKAGYKGTNKGAYFQSQCVDSTNADQTWQAIQEKMSYGSGIAPGIGDPHPGDLGDAPTPSRSSSKASKRSSFQDLRKATALGLPFMKQHDQSYPSIHQDRTSEESIDNTGLRKQKSRKELSKQAKLLKKVSNLEDKLERARRELRQLTGNEERLPAPTPERKSMSFDMDPGSYPRKFVPGALPTLPSERLLDQQAVLSESPEPATELTALPSMESRAGISLAEAQPSQGTIANRSPHRRPGEPRPSSMGKESSSRKRKSPIPEPVVASRNPNHRDESCPTRRIDVDRDNLSLPLPDYDDDLIDFGLLSPPRQPKLQKFEADDSPGSVERKRHLDLFAHHPPGSMHKRSPSTQSRLSSSAITRSPSSKAVRSPPPLRMRRAHSNLRSVSPSITAVPDPDTAITNMGLSSSPLQTDRHSTFYMQPHRQLNPNRSPSSSPSKSSPSRKRRRQHEDIPPVPPLPKELLMNAAKVNSSPRKSLSPEKGHMGTEDALEMPSGTENYPWPEDIF
ncbi:hypothetical protein N7462_005450 [Penicillium macrosclerotiorum]|uniref:uncharacterized protein n=1 Tax=Penicillium macrosclerotiorum TaxID=303699 RepID=UPI0025470C2A|nr:uncharacterized protein N7462_005450 [Penicillium macrosclerotiorum]KAJ5682285.1 hypothetical protein N7462_005450 [Penicillium macrosclerotiorum]